MERSLLRNLGSYTTSENQWIASKYSSNSSYIKSPMGSGWPKMEDMGSRWPATADCATGALFTDLARQPHGRLGLAAVDGRAGAVLIRRKEVSTGRISVRHFHLMARTVLTIRRLFGRGHAWGFRLTPRIPQCTSGCHSAAPATLHPYQPPDAERKFYPLTHFRAASFCCNGRAWQSTLALTQSVHGRKGSHCNNINIPIVINRTLNAEEK
ncbi:hypothetical protein AFLA_010010 [Aspergillus flavus NRRL3357]|nr:hypothetical protein AFLA_010010 [Aspergillus flavus NRRL3357]